MFDLVQNLQFAVHGGGDSGGGVAGLVDGILAFAETLVSMSPAEMFSHLMPGIAGLKNMHPLWVHFPIALLSLFLLVDFVAVVSRKVEWRTFASGLLFLGTLFAGLTMIAGLLAAHSVPHGGDVHEIMENHEHLGISVFLLSLALSGWRWLSKSRIEGPANVLFLILSTVLVVLLLFTADLGGYMVYKFGVAVEAADTSNEAAALKHLHGDEDIDHEHHGTHEH